MDEELDTLPTSRPLHDVDAIERIIDAGVPDVHQGYGGRVLEMGKRYQAIAQEYPRIGKYVHVYHPDLQGPMDICEIIWGSTMFYSLYDRPGLVKALLEVVTETYITFMRAWMEVVPFRERTKELLAKALPPGAGVGNPVDCLPTRSGESIGEVLTNPR